MPFGDLVVPALVGEGRQQWHRVGRARQTVLMLTVYGASVLTLMMVMYALERRHRLFVFAFAFGCGLSSVYGFLAGTWPFGFVEAIWMVIALARYFSLVRAPATAEG